MTCVVRLALPQQRQPRSALPQDLVAETRRHFLVAVGVVADTEPFGLGQSLQAWAEGAGAVVKVAITVRVLEIGGPRRDVGKDDRAAVVLQTLGQSRDQQRPPGGPAQPVAEIGMADVERHQPVALVDGDAVALQPMAPRQATGGDGRRCGAGGRGKDAAVAGEGLPFPGQGAQVGGQAGGHHVGPKPVTYDDDGAFHSAVLIPDFRRHYSPSTIRPSTATAPWPLGLTTRGLVSASSTARPWTFSSHDTA